MPKGRVSCIWCHPGLEISMRLYAIQEQPFQVLRLLMKADGDVVTREQLRAALWPEDTFVDFEHGVNTAVKKLRQALKDSAEEPKFVETLPKIGYRFIVPVEWVAEAHDKSASQRVVAIAPPGSTPVPTIQATTPSPRESRGRLQIALVAIGLLILAAAGGYLLRPRPQVKPNELTIIPFTTFPGFEIGPSFSPDGNQIVFAWFGYEKEFQFDLYIKQVGQERTVQLTHHPATFLGAAWSPDSRFIAFMRQAEPEASGIYLISSLGGSERKLTNITQYGDWSPIGLSWSADGKWLAFAKANSSATNANSSAGSFQYSLGKRGHHRRAGSASSFAGLRAYVATRIFTRRQTSRFRLCVDRGSRYDLRANPRWQRSA